MKPGDEMLWKWPPGSEPVLIELKSDDEDGYWFVKLASANVWYRVHATELVPAPSAEVGQS